MIIESLIYYNIEFLINDWILYIKLINIIISNIIKNYNKYLPIKIHIDSSKIPKKIEKIELSRNGEPSKDY